MLFLAKKLPINIFYCIFSGKKNEVGPGCMSSIGLHDNSNHYEAFMLQALLRKLFATDHNFLN